MIFHFSWKYGYRPEHIFWGFLCLEPTTATDDIQQKNKKLGRLINCGINTRTAKTSHKYDGGFLNNTIKIYIVQVKLHCTRKYILNIVHCSFWYHHSTDISLSISMHLILVTLSVTWSVLYFFNSIEPKLYQIISC